MRRILGSLLAIVLFTSAAHAGQAPAVLTTPNAAGDQVIFYYDARSSFTTFLSIRNGSASDIAVGLVFYGPTFGTPFSQTLTIPGGAVSIIDTSILRGQGLPAQTGVAFATAVDGAGQPITSGALSGNFTIANLLAGSAFGAAGAARSTLTDGGNVPLKGSVIDGSHAVFTPIQPTSALLAAYYDPNSLAPVASSGNQLVFVNFEDRYIPNWKASIGSTTWAVTTTRSNGVSIGDTNFVANGVTVTDLASVAGPGVNGSAGSMQFVAADGTDDLSRLIYFTESLGTFGTGYLLPPIPVE